MKRVLVEGVMGVIITLAAFLGGGLVWAEPNEEEVTRPSITVVSVSQNGVNAEKVWDEGLYRSYYLEGDDDSYGDWYYRVPYSADKVEIGVLVEGLAEGEEYRLSYSKTVTAEDNGTVVYIEATPSVSMSDGVSCYEDEEEHWTSCDGDYYANEYSIGLDLYKNTGQYEWYDYERVILRPDVVGNESIEILSITQDGNNVVFDKTGRQKDWSVPQTLNEYQIMDYSKPVTIEYKLKNLRVGWNYYGSIGGRSIRSFVADSDAVVGTMEVDLKGMDRHSHVYASLSGSSVDGYYSASVNIYYRMADEDFEPLGIFIVDWIKQNDVVVEPSVTPGEYGDGKIYTFDLNDVQDVKVKYRVTAATDDMDYIFITTVYPNVGSGGTYWNSDRVTVSGRELKEGIEVTVPARYGESDRSPFTLGVQTVVVTNMPGGGSSASSEGRYVTYQQEGNDEYDKLSLNFYEDPKIPRYSVNYNYGVYQDGVEVNANSEGKYVISDYTKPINVKVGIKDGTSEKYCIVERRTYLDGNNEYLNGSYDYGSMTSCKENNDGSWEYEINEQLNIEASTTRVDFELHDAATTTNSGYILDKKLGEFTVDFAYADYDSEHIPRVVVSEVRQGGIVVEPTKSEYSSETSFKLNTVEDYEYDIKGYDLLEGDELSMHSNSSLLEYSKEEMERGLTIPMAAGYGSSSFVYSKYSQVFGNIYLSYQGKRTYFSSYSDLNGDKPRYDMCVKYLNDTKCIGPIAYPSYGMLSSDYYATVDVDHYDAANNPVVLYFKGMNYDEGTTYNLNVNIRYMGEVIVNENFAITGAELNSGTYKRFFDEPKYVKYSQMFDGTFAEGGFDIKAKVGELTRTTEFMFNGGDDISMGLVTADGLTQDAYYNYEGGGMGSGGGYVAFAYLSSVNVPRQLFGDHAYLYLGPLMHSTEGVNYHVYKDSVEKEIGDLRGAVLVQEGVANTTGNNGLVRIEKDAESDELCYTVVLEKSGRVLSVHKYIINLTNEERDWTGFAVGLRSDDGILNNRGYSSSYGYYDMLGEAPVRVVAYGARLDESKTYTLDFRVIGYSGSVLYSDSKAVSASAFDGETTLFTIPYSSMFVDYLSDAYMYATLKDENGADLMERSIYVWRLDEATGVDSGMDDLYAEVRALEANGDDDVEIENNVPAEVADVEIEGDVVTVQSKKACVVIGKVNGKYVRLNAEFDKDLGDGKKSYEFNAEGATDIKVALKGDLDMGGKVNARDSVKIRYSILSSSNAKHIELTELEKLLADVDGNGKVNVRDSVAVRYSLLSASNERHMDLGW